MSERTPSYAIAAAIVFLFFAMDTIFGRIVPHHQDHHYMDLFFGAWLGALAGRLAYRSDISAPSPTPPGQNR